MPGASRDFINSQATDSSFWSPEPLVPLSRLGLENEKQVALGTHDLNGKSLTKGIQSDQPFQTSCERTHFERVDLIGFPLFYSISNIILFYLLDSTRAAIGQFSGPYSTARPVKSKTLFLRALFQD